MGLDRALYELSTPFVLTVGGTDYQVRVPFDVHQTMASDLLTYRRREPVVRRCGCCDRCPHVERFHEELHSIEEVIKAGWLMPA